MVGNFVLWWHVSGAVKSNLRPYNQRITSTNDNPQYNYPRYNALFHIFHIKCHCFAQKGNTACNVKPDVSQWKVKLRNDIGLPTIYRRIYCRTFLTLSNKPSYYIRKWIRIQHVSPSCQNQQNGMCAQQRLGSAWASAESDQSSLSAWRKLRSLATHWAHSKDSDQTGQMPRLIWVFAGRTDQFVSFVTRRLMYDLST